MEPSDPRMKKMAKNKDDKWEIESSFSAEEETKSETTNEIEVSSARKAEIMNDEDKTEKEKEELLKKEEKKGKTKRLLTRWFLSSNVGHNRLVVATDFIVRWT